jgi:hypothetical protein
MKMITRRTFFSMLGVIGSAVIAPGSFIFADPQKERKSCILSVDSFHRCICGGKPATKYESYLSEYGPTSNPVRQNPRNMVRIECSDCHLSTIPFTTVTGASELWNQYTSNFLSFYPGINRQSDGYIVWGFPNRNLEIIGARTASFK